MASSADHVLLAVDEASLTYAEADRRSAELAAALMAHGAGAGTRVGLLFPNGPEFVVAWLAAARIGAVSVPLSTFSTSAELLGLLRGADVTFLLAAPRYRSQDYVASLSAGHHRPRPVRAASFVVRIGVVAAAHRVHSIPVRAWTPVDH